MITLLSFIEKSETNTPQIYLNVCNYSAYIKVKNGGVIGDIAIK